jgi:hypothetical protein
MGNKLIEKAFLEIHRNMRPLSRDDLATHKEQKKKGRGNASNYVNHILQKKNGRKGDLLGNGSK